LKYSVYQSVKGCYLHCPRCEADMIPEEREGTGPNFLGLWCTHCGRWIEWVAKPQNDNKRTKTSKYTFQDIGIFRCEICGRSQAWLKLVREWLEIHHKLPLEEGGEDTRENLLIVCNRHHKMIHDIRDYEYHHLKSIIDPALES
jgi:5-methylcytosine-specific restriction endonuclease McrA